MSTLEVKVWRGGADGRFQTFQVPRRDAQTVLDVVTYIQRRLDPTLAYRFACRVGMCGSCAMTVNGRPRWTCRTHVADVAPKDMLEIAPLANLPIVRDLVTDMREFFDKWARARAQFQPTQTRRDDFARIEPASPARRAIDAAIECIGCGVCYAACDVVAWNRDYLGPAALNRADNHRFVGVVWPIFRKFGEPLFVHVVGLAAYVHLVNLDDFTLADQ